MRACFFTFADEVGMEKMGGKELIASAKHFHPEIPFIRIDGEQMNKALKSISSHTLIAHFGKFLATQYDLVIHIGCDSLILDRLDELFIPDYEVGGVLNNNNFDLRVSVLNINDNYINAHFIASWKLLFWWQWDKSCQKYALQLPYIEQDVLNILFHYGGWDIKIFDATKDYWGIKARGQWKNFVKKEDGIYLNDEKVKVFHYAGGIVPVKNNYEEMFDGEVAEYIRGVSK